jgi:hypothetical protein
MKKSTKVMGPMRYLSSENMKYKILSKKRVFVSPSFSASDESYVSTGDMMAGIFTSLRSILSQDSRVHHLYPRCGKKLEKVRKSLWR